MYFAANAVTTSIIGAVSGSLVYENIKNLFISKDARGIKYAVGEIADGVVITAEEKVALEMGVSPESVFNLGTLMIPFIVCIACLLGALLAMKMPRNYTPDVVSRELKRLNPDMNIPELEYEKAPEDKKEIIFVQVGLSVLSGFIFGFIWTGYLLKSVKELTSKGKSLITFALCCFVPFASAVCVYKINKTLSEKADELSVDIGKNGLLHSILSIVFPILPINVITLALLQRKVNKLYAELECK